MNWDAIGAVGEVLGAAGVIATLAYLGVQLRQNSRNLDQNTRAVVAAAEIQGGEQVMMGHLPIAENADLADLLLRGSHDFHALTPLERTRFSSFWHAALIAHQVYFFQNRRGLLHPDVWGTYSRQFDANVNQPGFRLWWERSKAVFDPSFQDYFEEKMREAG